MNLNPDAAHLYEVPPGALPHESSEKLYKDLKVPKGGGISPTVMKEALAAARKADTSVPANQAVCKGEPGHFHFRPPLSEEAAFAYTRVMAASVGVAAIQLLVNTGPGGIQAMRTISTDPSTGYQWW